MEKLFKIAEEHSIPIIDMHLNGKEEALCHSFDGKSIIAIDRRKLTGNADYKVKLSHELGHCVTGSFYNAACPVVPRGRCENRAARWAYSHTATRMELLSAIRSGDTELWQLAERFSVTEKFMYEMLVYYGLYNS